LSEDLLARLSDVPLLDRYDVYQRLIDYWAEVMQDDVYLIAADGWLDASRPRGIVEDKERNIKETADLTIGRGKRSKRYKMDLLPPALVASRHFADERTAIDALQAKQGAAARDLDEFVEEHSGEEDPLAEALNDKGKVTRDGVKDALKTLEDVAESEDDRDALTHCLALIEAESKAARDVKAAQGALDEKVLAHYRKLAEAEIKTLVVEDKWLASLRAAAYDEVQRLTQQLAGRLKELEERYARPLPALEREVDAFSAKVEGHLKKMGLSWG